MELRKLTRSETQQARLRAMGIEQAEDLLSYYPFRYEILQETPCTEWGINDTVTCEGVILRRASVIRLGKNRSMTRFPVMDQSQEFQVTLFNRP